VRPSLAPESGKRLIKRGLIYIITVFFGKKAKIFGQKVASSDFFHYICNMRAAHAGAV
jgi:hypothetical protein